MQQSTRSSSAQRKPFLFGVATADHQCEAYDPAYRDIRDEWEERRRRYGRLLEGGVSPLAVSAEAATLMEENRLVKEDERWKLLTLLIDFVPVDAYGQLLQDVG